MALVIDLRDLPQDHCWGRDPDVHILDRSWIFAARTRHTAPHDTTLPAPWTTDPRRPTTHVAYHHALNATPSHILRLRVHKRPAWEPKVYRLVGRSTCRGKRIQVCGSVCSGRSEASAHPATRWGCPLPHLTRTKRWFRGRSYRFNMEGTGGTSRSIPNPFLAGRHDEKPNTKTKTDHNGTMTMEAIIPIKQGRLSGSVLIGKNIRCNLCMMMNNCRIDLVHVNQWPCGLLLGAL